MSARAAPAGRILLPDSAGSEPSPSPVPTPSPTSNNTKLRANKDKELNVRGKPKSGRFWKTNKERFSSVNKTKGLKQPHEKKAALRLELKRIREISKQAKEKKTEEEELRKQRRRENIKRSEEKKRKSEIVQVITNTAKIKRMRKKQLRFIQKRDTNDAINASK